MSPTRRTASGRSTRISASSLSSRIAIRVSRGAALMMISRRIHLQGSFHRGRTVAVHGHRPPERRFLQRLERREKRRSPLHAESLAADPEETGIEIKGWKQAAEQEIGADVARR